MITTMIIIVKILCIVLWRIFVMMTTIIDLHLAIETRNAYVNGETDKKSVRKAVILLAMASLGITLFVWSFFVFPTLL